MEDWEINYLNTHKRRFDITISYLEENGVLRNNIKVLELGTPTVFTGILNERFDLDITNTSTDLSVVYGADRTYQRSRYR